MLLALAIGAPPGAAAASPVARYLSSSSAHHRAELTLLAGLGHANNGFNFDGYGRGGLLVRIPVGWRVVVHCTNRGGMRHSCAVVSGALGTQPAFPGAASPQPILGLSPGRTATFSFVASRVGTFRIACLVPGHMQARMWDVLDVVRTGRPTISARPGP
jgi:sulfocyanin SoxE-like protein